MINYDDVGAGGVGTTGERGVLSWICEKKNDEAQRLEEKFVNLASDRFLDFC